FPLDQLAAALHDAGVRRVGTLWARGEFVYNGFRYDEYNPDKHRKESAEAFRDALVAAGIEVEARDVSVELEAPDGVEVLAEWSSMPLHVACTPINRQSHNEFADALVRHLGFVGRGESSYEAGAAEVIAWLEAEGLDIEGVAFHDGSGLSHDNRVSARQVVELTRHMQSNPYAAAWNRTMSVAGVDGTYKARMTWPET